MVRTIHALLLIASLVTCPFRCSGMVGVAYADAEQISACSCCTSRCEIPPLSASETGPVQQDQVPSAPDSDCQCGNCLCKGAVLTDDDSAHADFFAGFWGVDLLPQTASLAIVDLTTELSEGPTLLASAAGRPLRLILQSLQI